MKIRRFAFVAVLVLFSVCVANPTWSCRFNVRDVGFVDFGQEPYQLFIAYDQSTPKDQRDLLEQIGFAALLESNVQIELVDVEANPDHQAVRSMASLNIKERPAALLASPRGKMLHLPIPSEQGPYKDAVWDFMESVVTNQTRESILDISIDTFGIALIVEGKDEALNATAIQAAKDAVNQVASRMDSLPKEIKKPPVVKTISYQDAQKELVLLWGIGIDTQNLDQPHAAILYGRGRCIGDILRGKAITKNSVEEILSVIGLSCECGLDREWMMGRQFPLRWDMSRQEQVIANLGFDAESPLVKTEISQIMAIGQNNAAAGSGTSRDASLNPIMGYSEMVVEAAPVEPPDAPRVVESEPQVIASNEASAVQPSAQLPNTIQPEAITRENYLPQMTWGLMFLIVVASLSLIGGVSIIIWARSKNL